MRAIEANGRSASINSVCNPRRQTIAAARNRSQLAPLATKSSASPVHSDSIAFSSSGKGRMNSDKPDDLRLKPPTLFRRQHAYHRPNSLAVDLRGAESARVREQRLTANDADRRHQQRCTNHLKKSSRHVFSTSPVLRRRTPSVAPSSSRLRCDEIGRLSIGRGPRTQRSARRERSERANGGARTTHFAVLAIPSNFVLTSISGCAALGQDRSCQDASASVLLASKMALYLFGSP